MSERRLLGDVLERNVRSARGRRHTAVHDVERFRGIVRELRGSTDPTPLPDYVSDLDAAQPMEETQVLVWLNQIKEMGNENFKVSQRWWCLWGLFLSCACARGSGRAVCSEGVNI